MDEEEDPMDAAARAMGIIPGDPAYGFYKNMRHMVDEIRDVPGEVAKELAKVVPPLLDQMKPAITADDIKALTCAAGRNATYEISRSIDRAVVQRYRWWFWGAAVGLVLTFGIGYGVGYWGARPAGTKCEAQRRGVVCWYWDVPPPETGK